MVTQKYKLNRLILMFKNHKQSLLFLLGLLIFLQKSTLMAQTTGDSIVWVWKPKTPINEKELSSSWRFQGRVGQKLENKDSILSIAFGNDNDMKLFGDFSSDLNSTLKRQSNGVIELHLYPNLITDSLILENGSFTVKGAVFESPFRTPAKEIFPTKIFAGWDGKKLITFYPTIYLNNNDQLEMCFLIVMFPLKPENNASGLQANTVILDKTLLIGTSTVSSDYWTPISKALEIKGGGLRFQREGISLLAGTQIRKR